MEFYLHKERSDSRQICFRARRGVRELGLPASKELEQQTANRARAAGTQSESVTNLKSATI